MSYYYDDASSNVDYYNNNNAYQQQPNSYGQKPRPQQYGNNPPQQQQQQYRPPPPEAVAGASRPWHYGICHCCSDCNSCIEAWCCSYCQISRQYNMIRKGKPEIDWLCCLGMAFGTMCIATFVLWIGACMVRQRVRDRYGIEGNSCGDCCVTCWCTSCSVQQQLLEMTSVSDFPGACCYDASQGQYMT
ncbi:PLAC8 family, putative [Angomonas deanei]|uniref:PLAC8 family, putative n=1 Tax=Angomonas deanei TaxID=59799 RepID=A0A7G2CIU8_9TRYP|nr:PLAC8 family, putative [Angomonas deanei]